MATASASAATAAGAGAAAAAAAAPDRAVCGSRLEQVMGPVPVMSQGVAPNRLNRCESRRHPPWFAYVPSSPVPVLRLNPQQGSAYQY